MIASAVSASATAADASAISLLKTESNAATAVTNATTNHRRSRSAATNGTYRQAGALIRVLNSF